MDILSAQTASSEFLSLLTVQLQNQDPIDPVDQEGLINDLTQFSILEGIQNLNASFEEVLQLQELTQGLDLVGRQVQFLDGAGVIQSGTVNQLLTSNNEIRIDLGDRSVSIADVVAVGDVVDS